LGHRLRLGEQHRAFRNRRLAFPKAQSCPQHIDDHATIDKIFAEYAGANELVDQDLLLERDRLIKQGRYGWNKTEDYNDSGLRLGWSTGAERPKRSASKTLPNLLQNASPSRSACAQHSTFKGPRSASGRTAAPRKRVRSIVRFLYGGRRDSTSRRNDNGALDQQRRRGRSIV